LNTANISLYGALILAALTIIGNLITTLVSKNNEYKQARFKTVMECVFKEYEYK